MNLNSTLPLKWWLTLGVLIFSFVGVLSWYGLQWKASLPLAFPDPTLESQNAPVQIEPDPREEAAHLEALLEHRFDVWVQEQREMLQEDAQIRRAIAQDRHTQVLEELKTQAEQLAQLQKLLHEQQQDLKHIRAGLEDDTQLTDHQPSFVFRGVEVWHGQLYALLEYQGQIFPVRQGEARLGWRIREIDREHRRIHVAKGTITHTLEEQ